MSLYPPHCIFPLGPKPSQVLIQNLHVQAQNAIHVCNDLSPQALPEEMSLEPRVNLFLSGGQSDEVYFVLIYRFKYPLRNDLDRDVSPAATLAPIHHQSVLYMKGWIKTGELACTTPRHGTLGIPESGMHHWTLREDIEYVEFCFLYFQNTSFRSYRLK